MSNVWLSPADALLLTLILTANANANPMATQVSPADALLLARGCGGGGSNAGSAGAVVTRLDLIRSFRSIRPATMSTAGADAVAARLRPALCGEAGPSADK